MQFDVRGVVQLAGAGLQSLLGDRYLASVVEIPICRTFARLHVLHGTGWNEPDGAKIGGYVLHYADGRQLELPILYGQDVRDWWLPADRGNSIHATVAWTGRSPALHAGEDCFLRLFKRNWDNPRPEVEVESIDFTSTMTRCGPFLIALTVE